MADRVSTSLFGGDKPFLKYFFNSNDILGELVTINLRESSNVIGLILGFGVITIIAVVIPTITLKLAASSARDNFIHVQEKVNSDTFKGMVFWPYKWVKINILIIVLSLSAFGLIIPSLALYLLTLYLVGLISWIGFVIKKKLV